MKYCFHQMVIVQSQKMMLKHLLTSYYDKAHTFVINLII